MEYISHLIVHFAQNAMRQQFTTETIWKLFKSLQ